MFLAEIKCGHHVGYVDALRDQTRFAINHRVIDLAGLVVPLISGFNKIPPELALEFTNIFLFHILLSFCSNNSCPEETAASRSVTYWLGNRHSLGGPSCLGC